MTSVLWSKPISLIFDFVSFRYCNSHLQVLGIVPKKSRKKKLNDQNDSTSQNPSRTSQAEIFSPRSTQNAVVKRVERSTLYTGTSKPSTDESASKKAKMLSSNPVLLELVGTYSRARSQRRDLFPYYGE